MKCSNCGTRNTKKSKHCKECGEELVVFAPPAAAAPAATVIIREEKRRGVPWYILVLICLILLVLLCGLCVWLDFAAVPGAIRDRLPDPIGEIWDVIIQICITWWGDIGFDGLDLDISFDGCPGELQISDRIDYGCGDKLSVLLRSPYDFPAPDGRYSVHFGQYTYNCETLTDLPNLLQCYFLHVDQTEYLDLRVYAYQDTSCLLYSKDNVWFPTEQDLGCSSPDQSSCSIRAGGGTGFFTMDPAECSSVSGTYDGMSWCSCP